MPLGICFLRRKKCPVEFIMCRREVCLLGKSNRGSFSLADFFPAFPSLLYSFCKSPSPPFCNKWSHTKEHAGNSATQNYTASPLLYKRSVCGLGFICNCKWNRPTTVFIILLNWISVTKPRQNYYPQVNSLHGVAKGSWEALKQMQDKTGYHKAVIWCWYHLFEWGEVSLEEQGHFNMRDSLEIQQRPEKMRIK